MNIANLTFDPLVPLPALLGLAVFALLFLALALWRKLAGWWLRGLAALAVLAALANPALQEEDRAPLSDIVIAVVDESASQKVSDRADQSAAALERVQAEVAAMENTELRVIRLGDGEGDAGTQAMTALSEALAEEPRSRVAGAILITDGQVHDMNLAPNLPAPVHVLLTGRENDWDRRLIIRNAPAFAIINEETKMTIRVEDSGNVPAAVAGVAELSIAVDGEIPMTFSVPVGQDMEMPIRLTHGGMNVLQFAVTPVAGELTDRNNAAVLQVNGVRDRLRVLLVSGEPHAGERVWRNLLKSDPSVDLVHFTILRPPEKQDGVPVEELSLIAFPTRELFIEKVKEFDLIIFDRFRLRGILPTEYLENIRDYVREGGTVLVAAGPEFGTVDGLWRSPLNDILPVDVTSRVLEGGFRPKLTDLGHKHPVTQGLDADAPAEGWGRWFRQMEISARPGGQVVMTGANELPLLVLAREGQGRVAVLASDHAWLWGRGYEGGGPQLEMLRRLAHWMLKEPELEEETLTATVEGDQLVIERRTIADLPPGQVMVTLPDGSEMLLPLAEAGPGRYTGGMATKGMGLYRLAEGDLERVIAVGPPAPKEYEEIIASGDKLVDFVDATKGGILRIENGLPDIRQVAEGRVAAGRGWIGLTPRGAYVTQDVQIAALLPGWVWLLLAAGLSLAAWLREGRFGGQRRT
jgi:hypothetical protein